MTTRLGRSRAAKAYSIDWSDSLVVLEIPSRSDTIHFRAYAEPIGTGTVLAWAVGRLRAATANTSDICLFIDRTEVPRVEAVLAAGSSVLLWPSSGQGSLTDFEQLSRKTQKTRLLIVDLSAACLPAVLFERLLQDHATHGNHATSLSLLPCAVSPVLVEAELVSALVQGLPGLPSHVLPQDVRAAVAGLERAVHAMGASAPIRLRQLAPVSAGEQTRRSWPYTMSIDSPDDVEILRRVLGQCSDHPQSPALDYGEPMDRWTEVARNYGEAQLTELCRCGSGQRKRPSRERRRVLYVQSPSAFTGGEQVLVLLAEGIAKEFVPPFEVSALIAYAGALTDRLTEVGAQVHTAQRDFAQGSVEHYLYSRRMLKEVCPGLVHAHTLAGVPFGCAIAELDVPFVQHVHVASERGIGQFKSQITLASAVIAISEFVKQRLIRFGTDPTKIHVIRNGVWLAEAEETSSGAKDGRARVRTRQACGVPEDAPVVLVPARFAANKRHDVAVEAFAKLRTRLPSVHLLLAGEAFAGDRPVLQAVESRIDRLRLRDRVHRLGFWADMPALYAASDVLLLPSEDDPLPLTVLEGMAAGVPVVAARSGGTPEMIEHGASGLLVEPGNGEGFAAALAQVLTDEERRTSLIDGGLARCRAEFSLSRFVGQVGRLYERVLAGEPVAAGDV